MINFKNRAIAGTAALIATLATIGAAAPLRAETTSKVVSYADLDLSSVSGEAALARRIRSAAKTVCGPLDLSNMAIVRDCRHRAIATANMNVRLALASRDRAAIQLAAAR